MWKKVLSGILCLLLAVGAFAGCETGGYVVRSCKENANADGFSAEYGYFNGKREYKVKVEEGETLIVTVELKTEEGSLALTVGQEGKEPVYTGNTGSDLPASFTVNIKDSGTYIIRFDAKAHKGSYQVSYQRVK